MKDVESLRVTTNPRLVWFINYAIDEVSARLSQKDEYAAWLGWAAAWKSGERAPAVCVAIARECFDRKGSAVWGSFGQLACF